MPEVFRTSPEGTVAASTTVDDPAKQEKPVMIRKGKALPVWRYNSRTSPTCTCDCAIPDLDPHTHRSMFL
jgi:hypothetical protein